MASRYGPPAQKKFNGKYYTRDGDPRNTMAGAVRNAKNFRINGLLARVFPWTAADGTKYHATYYRTARRNS